MAFFIVMMCCGAYLAAMSSDNVTIINISYAMLSIGGCGTSISYAMLQERIEKLEKRKDD